MPMQGVRAERRVLQNGLRSAEETQRVAEEWPRAISATAHAPASPLVAAPDAVHIDTTHKSIDESSLRWNGW